MCNSIRFAQISRNTITYHHGRILLITLKIRITWKQNCSCPMQRSTHQRFQHNTSNITRPTTAYIAVRTRSRMCRNAVLALPTEDAVLRNASLRWLVWCRRTEGETNAWVFGTRHIIVVSARVHTTVKLCFLDLEPLLLYSSSSSIDLRRITRLSRPRSRPSAGNRTRELCISSQKLWPLDHRGGRGM